ncbi:hypothetical protein AVEN_225166-1 [Araneus ventricosus]|uniref:Uncharacterized protein n=1 Tax=Araneus ventricosus TaxID=182803 RepID=A0A4Y2FR73_ARAVE|nr:hypothetical protein AVEN_225166-1 [Araneus ventricosus]
MKPVQRFQETGLFERHPRSCRPSLTEGRVTTVQRVMQEIASKSSAGNSNFCEAGKTLWLPESSIRRILHKILRDQAIRCRTNYSHCTRYYCLVSPVGNHLTCGLW